MNVGEGIKVSWAVTVGGDGYWTRRTGVTVVDHLGLAYVDDSRPGKLYGELRARFTPESWDAERNSLVYTDRTWIAAFHELLQTLGFSREAARAVNYSEAGMQGEDYVSLDAGHAFMSEWDRVRGSR